MSVYPAPSENVPVFNPSDYQTSSTALTIGTADARYLQLSGGVERGLVTFNAGLSTASISNSGSTFTVPSSSGQLALVSQIPSGSGFVDLTTNQTVGGIKTFSDYVRISDQYGLNQTNISGCTIYSNAFTAGLGGFQVDTSDQSTGFGIFKLPAMASSATYTFPSDSGYLAYTIGNYFTTVSQGLSLANAQTISNSTYLAGCTINCSSTTYTDSATAASGVVAQVSDVLIGARTFVGTNASITYTSAASLRIIGAPIASTNITMTKTYAMLIDAGTVYLKGLGSATQPALGIGVLGNEGIYSSAAGTINLATAGTLRLTLTSSVLTLASGISITGSGASTFTSGSGGHVGTGPLSSSLASSAATCSVRPTNTTNTGLFGTAGTLIGISVGGTGIVSCATTGASITGTLSASGVSTLTGGAKIGSTGTTVTQMIYGTGTTGAVVGLNFGSQTIAVSFGVTFSSTPNVIACITNGAIGTNINACTIAVSNITTTGCNVNITNPFTSATSTTVTMAYRAWN